MGSDDVRARAEAVDAVALLFAKRRQPAPTMDGAHQPNPAEIKAAQEAVEIVRAALAVAPATAAHPSSMPPGFDWNPPCPDDAPTRDVLLYALRCAKAWEPGARILGNLRACDLSRALTDTLTAPAPPVGSPETCPTCYGRVRNRPGNVSTEGTRVQLCDDPWHTTPPTPPAPADDAGAERAVVEAAVRSAIDALVKERDQARRQRDGMTEQYEAAMEVIHRNAGARRDGLCGILAWIDEAKEATARADKAEKDRDDARALLREAKDLMFDRDLFPVCSGPAPLRWRERIDDALDRKGGDGAAIETFKAVKCFKAGGVMVHVDPEAPPGSMNVVPPGYICPLCSGDGAGEGGRE